MNDPKPDASIPLITKLSPHDNAAITLQFQLVISQADERIYNVTENLRILHATAKQLDLIKHPAHKQNHSTMLQTQALQTNAIMSDFLNFAVFGMANVGSRIFSGYVKPSTLFFDGTKDPMDLVAEDPTLAKSFLPEGRPLITFIDAATQLRTLDTAQLDRETMLAAENIGNLSRDYLNQSLALTRAEPGKLPTLKWLLNVAAQRAVLFDEYYKQLTRQVNQILPVREEQLAPDSQPSPKSLDMVAQHVRAGLGKLLTRYIDMEPPLNTAKPRRQHSKQVIH